MKRFQFLPCRLGQCLALMAGLILASTAGAATINVLTADAPTPGPDDQYQTNFLAAAQSPPPGGGEFNYYLDANPSPGQTFTTGSNPDGYTLNSVYLYDSDNTGGSLGTQTFTLGLYSVSGSTATLLSTFTSQSVALTDFTWFQWTNFSTVILQPNTQYAYAMWRNGSGWCNLGTVSNATYSGGEVARVPQGGGTMTFSSEADWDAAFIVGLTPITVPVVGPTTFSPYPIVLPGAGATASAPVSGPGPYYYQWRTDGAGGGALTNIPAATNATLTIDTTGFALGSHLFDLVVSNDTSAATGQVGVLTVQQAIGIPGVIGIKFGFTNGYATSDAPYPADNTGVATGQLVPPSSQPLTEIGRWNNLMADITNGADSATKSVAINQTWNIDHDSAGNSLSGVTLTPSGFNDGWFSGGTGCAAGRLLYTCWKFDTGNGQATGFGHNYGSFTLSGLPESVYDVVVFINNNNGNYWGNAQANDVVAQNSPDVDNTSYGFNGASADPCGLAMPLHTYSGYNGGNPANSVNYVKMNGVETVGGNITVSVVLFGGGSMGVSGVELIPALGLNRLVDTTPNFVDTIVGDSVVFTTSYSDSPAVEFEWVKVSGGVTNTLSSGVVTTTNNGVVTSTVTLTDLQVGDSGTYQARVMNAANNAFFEFTTPATLQVNNPPAPVGGVVVEYAAQAASGSFYPAWTVDTSTNNLVFGFPIGGGTEGTFLPGPGDYSLDGCIGDPSILVDGVLGNSKPLMISCGAVGGAGESATFALLTNASPYGFEIGKIEIYGGWTDGGRRDQQYEVRYSTVLDPTNFVSLISTYYLPDDPYGTAIATRTALVPTDGVLAHNVAAIEINWNVTPQHLNGYAGYSEVAVLGVPSTGLAAPTPPVVSATQTGGSLIIAGVGGTANSSYTLLEATNLAAPVNWETNSTGFLDGAGAFSNSIPITPEPPIRFFRVRLP